MAILGVGPSAGMAITTQPHRIAVNFVDRWFELLQNRFLAGTALTVATFFGCVLGAIAAPPLTRWIIDRLDQFFKDDRKGSKTHRLSIASVIFCFFGLPVAIINYKMLKIFQLPLSRRFSMTLTLFPPVVFALCEAYFYGEEPSEGE